LGRHSRPAQVRRHHLSTETKNATHQPSCGRSAATLACRAACTVSTHCRERGKSRSHRVLGRHGRPAQVRRHHLSTETKNATRQHSCGRSAAALHVEQLAPCRHIVVCVANRAATVYWAATAVPRKSVDTTCQQKPKTRLASILAAARPRLLHVEQLAPCRHIVVCVANRSAFVYWAATAVPRKSVDTTCQQKPKTRLVSIFAAARPRRCMSNSFNRVDTLP